MKVVFKGKELFGAMGKVIRGVMNRAVLPVLSGILLEGEGEKARLTATDLEMGIHAECAARFVEGGQVVLPGKIFWNIVRGTQGTELEMTTLPGSVLEIKAGKSYYRLSGYPAADFPVFPPYPEDGAVRMGGMALREAISRTYFAVSRDEMRPTLTGLLFELENRFVNLVATDGHRLSVARLPAEGIEEGQFERFLVPVRAAVEMIRMIQDQEAELFFGHGRVLLRCGTSALFSRLIEGEFPQYREFLSQESITRITVSRDSLIAVLERVSVVFIEEFGVVRMKVLEKRLEFVVQSPELGEARDELEASVEGKRLEIAYNIRYFLEAIKAAPWEMIELGITGEITPTRIGGSGDEYECILMPLRSEEDGEIKGS
ncbi:MAG TPA: DNA polymerase III subunit beta [Atribacteraceae bacterium]|nr:DNA polymerase III subunit beta [Atribacteraceae bacterium]